MGKNEIIDYIKIISITLAITFFVVIATLLVIKSNVYNDQENINPKKQAQEDATVDFYLIGVLIEKNKYMETKSPDDYRINIKLGRLYELKKDYQNADANYKLAIEKAPYDQYSPEYRLARSYIAQNKLDEAQSVMEGIVDGPNTRLIRYKADIYKRLGNAYYAAGYYDDAISKYNISTSYYNIINDKHNIKDIKDSTASSYVYLADAYMNKLEPQNAIFSLKMALSIVHAPIIKYKLALLLMSSDPGMAYQYFDEVFNEQPEIINYDTYYNFLLKLAEEAYSVGDITQAELFRFKIKKLRAFFKENILTDKDIKLDDIEGYLKINKLFRSYKVNIALKFKNTSKKNIDSLYLFFVIKDGNDIINKYSKEVVDKNHILGVGFYTPIIFASIPGHYISENDDLSQEMLTVEVYAAKTEKAYKYFMGTIDIDEKSHKQHANPVTKWIAHQYAILMEKITIKLPAFFF